MLKKAIILLLSITFTTVALAEHNQPKQQGPQWRYKPIQCSTPKEILDVLQKIGSKPLAGVINNYRWYKLCKYTNGNVL